MVAKPTIFIVDDDAAVLESLSALVNSFELQARGFSAVEDFLRVFSPDSPGCLLLDIHLPNADGLTIQEYFSNHEIDLPVIIISGTSDATKAVRAMRLGAVAFLQKGRFADSELLESIQHAISIDRERRRVRESQRHIAKCVSALTEPEKQVLNLLLNGVTHAQIAARLNVSRRTVENRRARIFHKLEVNTIPELMKIALAAGLFLDKSR